MVLLYPTDSEKRSHFSWYSDRGYNHPELLTVKLNGGRQPLQPHQDLYFVRCSVVLGRWRYSVASGKQNLSTYGLASKLL